MFEHAGFAVAVDPKSERVARAARVVHREASLAGLPEMLPLPATH
jgi:hypothetical protein